MDLDKITPKYVEDELNKVFYEHIPKRHMRIYTGIGGMDNFEESIDRFVGYKRIYIGKKPIRILNRLSLKLHKNRRGIYYKRVKI